MGRDVKIGASSKDGYVGRLDVIAGPSGRQQRTDMEKARIAAESLAPDASVAAVARRHGVTRWQIYDWRRRFRSVRMTSSREGIAPSPAFVPLTIEDGARTYSTADIIEVAIGDVLIRVGPDASEAHLARIFRAVRAAR
jgi:transposase